MCEVAKGQRRAFRDQDPPRICKKGTGSLLKGELEFSQSTPSSPTILQRASSLEKCFSEPEFFQKQQEYRKKERGGDPTTQESSKSCSSTRGSAENVNGDKQLEKTTSAEDFLKELAAKVPSSCRHVNEVIANGLQSDRDSCDGLTNAMRSPTQMYIGPTESLIQLARENASVGFNAMCEEGSVKARIALLEGRKMAPVLGVPPPPPPAPHMGPDGLILPRKPYNPCLTSNNHKDLRRELLFNQKIGKSVLNQKSELQRALEKQREAASRREAERNREESYKDDPRTAFQRAIEQRAKHIEMTVVQSQPLVEAPSNMLITARAKLRSRTDSQ